MRVQMEGEFPQMLGIKESLIKYVFEPNAAKVGSGSYITAARVTPARGMQTPEAGVQAEEVKAAVKKLRGR